MNFNECLKNKAPCGFNCPRRDLPACRKTCAEWQTYEAAQMAKYNSNFPPLYTGIATDGSRKRANVNQLIRSGKKKGW